MDAPTSLPLDPASLPERAPDPLVVLLHGVGLAPSIYSPVSLALRPVTSIAPHRPGYAPSDELELRGAHGATPRPATIGAPASSIATSVRWIRELVRRADRPVVLAGVSGGATLVVAALIARIPGVVGGVAHEPLVGPLAPELHTAVSAAAARLAREPGAMAATGFVRRLVGRDAWAGLAPAERRFTVAHSTVIRKEVPVFVRFAPTAASVASIVAPLVVTTGSTSPPARHAAATTIRGLCGATTITIGGSGHLVCAEQPEAFAHAIASLAQLADAR